MDSYIGSVTAFGFNFAPSGWLPCNGSLQPIASYEALYALIGTTYGGNGTTTFGLPDLRGRVPIHMGQGVGLPNYPLGQAAGSETTTISAANMAAHSHGASVTIPVNPVSTAPTPGGNYFGSTSGLYAATPDNVNTMAPVVTPSGPAGAGPIPISVLEQYTAVNYCICWSGVFPTHP